MNEIETIRRFGLTEKEAKAYILALREGEITSGSLIKKLKIYSKTAYEILNKLEEKGLFGNYVKSGAKHYHAIDPERLIELIKEKEIELKETEQNFRDILPNLRELRQKSLAKQQVEIFQGKKALKYIFEDVIKQGKEILIFGAGGKFKKAFPEYSELWHKKRIENKIKMKLLWNEELKNKKEENSNLEIRFLPREFENPAPAIIYRDKVAIIIWTEEPVAFLVESEEISRSFRNYFKILWKIARK